jgi:hypothetical protein
VSISFGRSTPPNYKHVASGTDLHLPWRVAPLEGKHYGTEVWDSDDGLVVNVWQHEEGCTPSVREQKRCGEPWTGEWTHEWREICCDGHWESESDYRRACVIVEAVNARYGSGAAL